MTSRKPTGQSCRFFDLSFELRLQIYEYLLIPGKVFFTPDEYSIRKEHRYKNKHGYQRPQLQLLRVCKQIHAEAEDVYLSKNLFVLPDYFVYHGPIVGSKVQNCSLVVDGHIFNADKPLFSENAAKHLKNISISFNPRRPAPESNSFHSGWENQRKRDARLSWARMTQPERMKLGHDIAILDLENHWSEAVQWLTEFFEPLGRSLDHLEIDITNAYCPVGCCRMPVSRPDPICTLLAATRPAHMVIVGAWDEEEQEEFLGHVKRFYQDWENEDNKRPYRRLGVEQIRRMHNIKFDPEEDVWGKFKKVPKRKSKSIPQR
jgi:hypothetical protein